jgi:antibiotic biosynthesis monooxygenase (ABM) superfamily enzyme
VTVLPYDDHDTTMKLIHSLDRTVWSEKVTTIVRSLRDPHGVRVVFQAQVVRGGPWGARKN